MKHATRLPFVHANAKRVHASDGGPSLGLRSGLDFSAMWWKGCSVEMHTVEERFKKTLSLTLTKQMRARVRVGVKVSWRICQAEVNVALSFNITVSLTLVYV